MARMTRRTWLATAMIAGSTAALSMAGVPLTLGFAGKDGAYAALLHGNGWSPWLLALTVLASTLLGLAGLVRDVRARVREGEADRRTGPRHRRE